MPHTGFYGPWVKAACRTSQVEEEPVSRESKREGFACHTQLSHMGLCCSGHLRVAPAASTPMAFALLRVMRLAVSMA